MLDDPEPAEAQFSAEDLVKALRLLFDVYCREHKIGLYQRPHVGIVDFLGWAGRRLDILTPEAWAADAGVSLDIARYVFGLSHRVDGASVMRGLWPFLILAHRSTVFAVRAVTVGVVIHFEDGTIAPLMQLNRRGVLSGDLGEAEVVSGIRTGADRLGDIVQKYGLIPLHDQHQGARGSCEDAIFKALIDALNASPHPLTTEQRRLMQELIGTMRSVVPGSIPPLHLRKVLGMPPDDAGSARLAALSDEALGPLKAVLEGAVRAVP